jgi:sugar O-acyltransferase (sialic acid O-acetyltransferase NeuD family)
MSGVRHKIIILGSSGHASVLVDAIELGGEYDIAGYLDDTIPIGTRRFNYPVLGVLKNGAMICAEHAIDGAVLAIGDNWWRRKVYSDLIENCPRLSFPIIKHPSAIVASSAKLEKGAVILSGSHAGPASFVGKFCIMNTSSSIDHDCVMQSFSSIAPGVSTGGHVQIGECSAIGVGASISDRISVGCHTVVGTGSSVVRNIPDFVVAYGNPARVRRSRPEGEPYVQPEEFRSPLTERRGAL